MTTESVSTDVRVRLDLFPAILVYPAGGTLEPVRAILTDEALHVWVNGASGPRLEFTRSPVGALSGSRLLGWDVEVPDGKVTLWSARGCGCGDALKTFDPWPGRHVIRV